MEEYCSNSVLKGLNVNILNVILSNQLLFCVVQQKNLLRPRTINMVISGSSGMVVFLMSTSWIVAARQQYASRMPCSFGLMVVKNFAIIKQV